MANQPSRPLRVPVRLPLRYYADKIVGSGQVENISIGGVFCALNNPAKDGDAVQISIDLGNGLGLRKIHARVVHSFKSDQRKVGAGLEFLDLKTIERRLIESYILKQLPTGISSYGFTHENQVDFQKNLPTFKLFIAGEDVDSGTYAYLPYVDALISDPLTTLKNVQSLQTGGPVDLNCSRFIFGRYCLASTSHVERAIESAHAAATIFKRFPEYRRRRIIDSIHDLLIKHKEELIKLMVIEGHPHRLAEWQANGMIKDCRRQTVSFYVNEMHREIESTRRSRVYLIRRPDGVVAVSPPRNAPCSCSYIAVWALFAGNALIIKPPLRSPVSTIFLWRNIISEACRLYGAPEGLINIVVGDSEQILQSWVDSPYVNDILYFGRSEQGLEIGKKIYKAGKKPILELSGNDYMIIWDDAPLHSAASSLLDGFLGSTQICMVPKKAFIHEAIFDNFVKIFVKKCQSLTVGLPSDPRSILSPVGKMDEFFDFLDDAKSKGAALICGGRRLNHLGLPDSKGLFVEPTVITVHGVEMAATMKCITEENYFPMIPLVKVGSVGGVDSAITNGMIFEKMITLLNQNMYGLRASVWSSSDQVVQQFVDRAHNSGLLLINAKHIGVSPCLATHGGVGKTGGPTGELNYVWQKTTHLQGVVVNKLP